MRTHGAHYAQEVLILAHPIRLYVLDGGTIEILDWSIYDPAAAAGTTRTLADPVYLIVHPHGRLVWDGGLADSLSDRREPLIVDDHAVFRVNNPVANQLRELGHSAGDIEYLGLSHFHPDHVGNVSLFSGATLLTQGDEYEAAFGPDALAHHYDPAGYASLKQNKVVMLDGDHDVFGDGSVMIKRFPGHTIGSQSLLVRLPEHGSILISGDLTHSMEGWRTKAIPPVLNHDVEQSARSLALAEKLIADESASLWVQHDYEQVQSLRRAPEYYS
jgi:N-acyl homoserine lactone hydrolase